VLTIQTVCSRLTGGLPKKARNEKISAARDRYAHQYPGARAEGHQNRRRRGEEASFPSKVP